jgi:hypothetical protein
MRILSSGIHVQTFEFWFFVAVVGTMTIWFCYRKRATGIPTTPAAINSHTKRCRTHGMKMDWMRAAMIVQKRVLE